jgi:hypothetical protein
VQFLRTRLQEAGPFQRPPGEAHLPQEVRQKGRQNRREPVRGPRARVRHLRARLQDQAPPQGAPAHARGEVFSVQRLRQGLRHQSRAAVAPEGAHRREAAHLRRLPEVLRPRGQFRLAHVDPLGPQTLQLQLLSQVFHPAVAPDVPLEDPQRGKTVFVLVLLQEFRFEGEFDRARADSHGGNPLRVSGVRKRVLRLQQHEEAPEEPQGRGAGEGAATAAALSRHKLDDAIGKRLVQLDLSRKYITANLFISTWNVILTKITNQVHGQFYTCILLWRQLYKSRILFK